MFQYSHSLVLFEEVIPQDKIFNEFPIRSYVKLSSAVAAVMVGRWGHQKNSEKDPKDHSFKVWFQMCKKFQALPTFNEFPIGSCEIKFIWGCLLSWLVRSLDKILIRTHLVIVQSKFGSNKPRSSKREYFLINFP